MLVSVEKSRSRGARRAGRDLTSHGPEVEAVRAHSALEIFAIAGPGLEPLVANELRALGIQGAAQPGGVAWRGNLRDVYLANLWSRIATRIVVRVAGFRARALGELARRAARVPWNEWISPGARVRLRVTARKSRLYHTGAIAQRISTAIAAAVPNAMTTLGQNEESTAEEEALVLVRVARDDVTISMDSSGVLLHRRGYRQATARAPLRETMAAAVLAAAGWPGSEPLLDPLCGSGTIAIEAAMRARNIAPGLERRFAFEHWPAHDDSQWKSILGDARSGVLPPGSGPRIAGSDRDAGAVAAASANAERAGVANDVAFTRAALSAAPWPAEGAWIVSNPPYGVRIGDRSSLRDLYAALGQMAARARALVVVTADPALEAQIGGSRDVILESRVGGIPIRAVRRWGSASSNLKDRVKSHDQNPDS